MMTNKSDILLDVRDLRTYFHTDEGLVRAVDGVTFTLNKGESLGLVGESGCGKSVTALSISRLLPSKRAEIVGGHIEYYRDNEEVCDMVALHPQGSEIREIRGNEIAMIFQEPMTSLNPVYTIGEQIVEMVQTHRQMNRREARDRAIEMLDLVGIASPQSRVNAYPHEFSGGMRQRAMIAMALSCNPRILLADEPTTALDVTIQAQILALLRELQEELGMATVLITHDLDIIGEMTERVAVMYMGKIQEMALTQEIFSEPKHPYTRGLLGSIPRIGSKGRLVPIEGSVPNPYVRLTGCVFKTRCPDRLKICNEVEPPIYETGPGHTVKCWLYE